MHVRTNIPAYVHNSTQAYLRIGMLALTNVCTDKNNAHAIN